MDHPTIEIRMIRQSDDSAVEEIIRTCLIEYGANRPGFAWQDPELSALTNAYQDTNKAYWVALANGQLVGGCGIAPVNPYVAAVCELQKMYVSSSYRGLGAGRQLLGTAQNFAQKHYRWCYLETFSTMVEAATLYQSAGFMALPKPLVDTEHNACDRWYLKDLQFNS